MVQILSRRVRGLVAVLAWLGTVGSLAAHQLDEYIQATLVSIEPGRISLEVNLTPGVAVAGWVLGLLDRDHDGSISTNEARDYAEALGTDLWVWLDHQELRFRLEAIEAASPAELRTGWGMIQVRFSAQIGPLEPGRHVLAVDNRHLPWISAYLLNAALPESKDIQVVCQSRNQNQSSGEIEFNVRRPTNWLGALGPFALLAASGAALFAATRRGPQAPAN